MFSFLKRKKSIKVHSPSGAIASVNPNNTQQHSNTQLELIRVVVKDTMRLHGIPLGWLACEVAVIPRSSGGSELLIQLVVMRWHDKLMHFAPALQQQLLLGLNRFDPRTDHSSYVVSWRFSPKCGNPFAQMPDPKFWLQSNPMPAKTEPMPAPDRRHAPRRKDFPLMEPSLFDLA